MLFSLVCDAGDLLQCDNTIEPSPGVLECDDQSISVQYDGISIGSTAVYTTSNDYCITSEEMRTCTSDMMWDGQKPTIKEGRLLNVN